MWHNKFKSFLLFMVLAGIGVMAFAQPNDLTLNVSVEEADMVYLNVSSKNTSGGTQDGTRKTFHVEDGDKELYTLRKIDTSYTEIVPDSGSGNWFACTFDDPNKKITPDMLSIDVDISIANKTCKLKESPAPSLKMNFYLSGITAFPATFTVYEYPEDTSAVYSYDSNAWPIASVTQSMELDYTHANIVFNAQGVNTPCTFGEDHEFEEDIDIAEVHVAAVISDAGDHSCTLYEEHPGPAPSLPVNLYLNIFAQGIDTTVALRVEEYHGTDTTPQQPVSEYPITMNYVDEALPITEELGGDYAYAMLKMVVKAGHAEHIYTCVLEDGTERITDMDTAYVYFDKSGEAPYCFVYKTALTPSLKVNFDFDDYWTPSVSGVRVETFDMVGGLAIEAWGLSTFEEDPEQSITYDRESFTEYTYITLQDIEGTKASTITCTFEEDSSAQIPPGMSEVQLRGYYDESTGFGCTLSR